MIRLQPFMEFLLWAGGVLSVGRCVQADSVEAIGRLLVLGSREENRKVSWRR